MRFPLGLHRAAFGVWAATLTVASWAQADLRANDVFLADRDGNPIDVKLGEEFYVGLRFTATGRITTPYRYRVDTPFGSLETQPIRLGLNAPGNYWICWGPFPAVMGGPIEVTGTLDPDHVVREPNRRNNARSMTFTPIPPNFPVETYNTQNLGGRLGLNLVWGRGSAPSQVTFWMPSPPTTYSQQVTAIPTPFPVLLSEKLEQPIEVRAYDGDGTTIQSDEMTSFVQASSIRTNRLLLIAFGSYSDPRQDVWRQPEQLIESNRSDIRNWASSALRRVPAWASTYEKAEALYRSVLAKCDYEYRPGLSASALNMARKRKGDCGGYSSLFVALCRASGIAARTVGGFTKGRDQWHVWAEFHVAGAGWVPVDPAYAEGRLAKGADDPIYFGVIPELNSRLTTMVGYDRELGSQSVPMLQSPAVFWQGRGVRLSSATPYCSLWSW